MPGLYAISPNRLKRATKFPEEPLNYNACKLGDSQPVTVGFSDAVGEILISNPTVSDRRPNFKFYI